MSAIGNVLWFIFGGFVMGIGRLTIAPLKGTAMHRGFFALKRLLQSMSYVATRRLIPCTARTIYS